MAISTSPVHQATATSTSVTITACAAGNTLVVMVVSYRSQGARTVSSLSCTNMTGWTKLVSGTNGGSLDVEIWAGYNNTGSASGTTVSITMSGSSSTLAVNVSEWSGVWTPTTTGEDGNGTTKTGSGTSASSNSETPAYTGELGLACIGYLSGTAVTTEPGGSWGNLTGVANSTTIRNQGNYLVPTAAGAALSPTWTIPNVGWVTTVAILRLPLKSSQACGPGATVALSAGIGRGRDLYGATASPTPDFARGRVWPPGATAAIAAGVSAARPPKAATVGGSTADLSAEMRRGRYVAMAGSIGIAEMQLGAIKLTAASQFLDRSVDPLPAHSYTISGWFRLDGLPGGVAFPPIFVRGGVDDNTHDYVIRAADGVLFLSYYAAPGGWASLDPLHEGWNYVAVTYDGGTGIAKGYLDGGLAVTSEAMPFPTADGLQLGLEPSNPDWILGSFSDVKVWSTVLTEAEIQAEMASAVPVKSADLYAYYPLAVDGSDESGNGNHLTVHGAPSLVAGPTLASSGGWAVLFAAALRNFERIFDAVMASWGSGDSYSTTFPATENPISQGDRWINGGSMAGLPHSDCRTVNGIVCGTQTGLVEFNDSVALLKGSWGNDQTVEATVYSTNQSSVIYEEVELFVRASATPQGCVGYEINIRSQSDGGSYANLMRWDVDGFVSLDSPPWGIAYGIHTGDVIKVTAIGDVIKAFINETEVLSAVDTTYPTGSPGVGFDLWLNGQQGNEALNLDFGFSSFSATSSGGGAITLTAIKAGLTQSLAAAMASFAGSAAKLTKRATIGAMASWLATIAKRADHNMSGGTMTFDAAIQRQNGKMLSAATAAFAAAICRGGRLLAATVALSAALSRKTVHQFASSTTAAMTAVINRGRLIAAATAAESAAFAKKISTGAAASLASWQVVYNAGKGAGVVVSASLVAFAGGITKRISKWFSAS